MPSPIRVLLLADTHLGFDLPIRPRVERRRRGHDFLANYQRALAPAAEGEVHIVVHGGDVFHRSRVPTSLVYQAFQPLARIADTGVPVFVVPGNHERSRIPHARIASHPGIHIFDHARSYVTRVGTVEVCLAGFPYERRGVRHRFRTLVESTGWKDTQAGVRLLCTHHCFEGATVGPAGFTFTNAPDVIRARDLPTPFAAALSGHIHRTQSLTHDLSGAPLRTPVLYPGSIERTSIAEKDERKGTLVLHLSPSTDGGTLDRVEFRELPTRPMIVIDLSTQGLDRLGLEHAVTGALNSVPQDAVLRLRLLGPTGPDSAPPLTAARLRALAPSTMNVECRAVGAERVPSPVPRSR